MADESIINYNDLSEYITKEYDRITKKNKQQLGNNLINTAKTFSTKYERYLKKVEKESKNIGKLEKNKSTREILVEARKLVYQNVQNNKLISEIGQAQVNFQKAIFDANGQVLITVKVQVDKQQIVARQLELQATRKANYKTFELEFNAGGNTVATQIFSEGSTNGQITENDIKFANSLMKQYESTQGKGGYVAEAIYSAALEIMSGDKTPFIKKVVQNLQNVDNESGLYTADYMQKYKIQNTEKEVEVAYQIKSSTASYIRLKQTHNAAIEILKQKGNPEGAYEIARNGQIKDAVGQKGIYKTFGDKEKLLEVVNNAIENANLEQYVKDMIGQIKI